MTDARIPDHCAWAARGHWSRAYDAAEAEIARLTAELEEVKADRDKWFESAGAHHVASMKQAQRADRAEFERDTARAETAMAYAVAADHCWNKRDLLAENAPDRSPPPLGERVRHGVDGARTGGQTDHDAGNQ